MNDIISLDVGGTVFKTSRSTLLKCPGSRLANMLDSQPNNGTYFLDRDPER